MSSKKLIVNADDFGQSKGVNNGIIRSFEQGIVTSASLMVRYPTASAAAEYARKNHLDLGLHVDLGEWLLAGENWEPLYEVVAMDDAEAVEEETVRQLQLFILMTGTNPTHLDSHQHVHMQEKIQPVFLEISRRLNVALRRCSGLVAYCGMFYGQHADSSPNHKAIGVHHLKKIISTLPEGVTELACHPGLDVESHTMYKTEREIEVTSLCDKSVMDAVTGSEVELSSFGSIPFTWSTPDEQKLTRVH